ncbi:MULTISPECIES: hypothetical protein [unclassified Dietzia]|uniref:hypothetical protein n=1 Tax=unclassified Dietzia TaxID=2617939 RepID=UPI0015F91AB2|nr:MULTISPECIES: hypothetical protein [unclassified Dietzia]MBB1022962.1 hypothetical protein [Dietzia sp. DQ12-76]MBB1026468.1 hypothetical protein [Dietzia sp. DQ11-38-2]
MLGQGHETVTVLGGTARTDAKGYPIPPQPPREVRGCVVQPTVLAQDTGRDRSGQVLEFRVLAPAGTVISSKDRVVIRGREFEVTAESFDWSINRRPALRSHRPLVEFIAKRGEG